MMYLTDGETVEFLAKCLSMLTRQGAMHMRESCSQPSDSGQEISSAEA